jgi:hypothetical protein
LNVNFTNSFNENYNITITYSPIDIWDLNDLIYGNIGTEGVGSSDPNPVL